MESVPPDVTNGDARPPMFIGKCLLLDPFATPSVSYPAIEYRVSDKVRGPADPRRELSETGYFGRILFHSRGRAPTGGFVVGRGLLQQVEGKRLNDRNRPRQVPGQTGSPHAGRRHHDTSGPAAGRLENRASSGDLHPDSHSARKARRWLWLGIVLLALAHHDFWLWDDARLVFGFLPVGMAYHVVYSILAALFWVIVLRWAWPDELEEWAGELPPAGDRSSR